MFLLGPLKIICQVRLQGGWSGIGMAKFQILKKSERRKKNSERNLKKGNPTFLPSFIVGTKKYIPLSFNNNIIKYPNISQIYPLLGNPPGLRHLLNLLNPFRSSCSSFSSLLVEGVSGGYWAIFRFEQVFQFGHFPRSNIDSEGTFKSSPI